MSLNSLSLVVLVLAGLVCAPLSKGESIARIWNEQNLAAIRIDFPAPTVHSRNLFHLSAAMWDAWAAYDPVAVGYCYNEVATAGDVALARQEAISYAAYRVLHSRYASSVNAATTQAALDAQMLALGYPIGVTSTLGASPAAVGNRVAGSILGFGSSDLSRETSSYNDPWYFPVNAPLILAVPGSTMNDPNRWQPLAFDFARTQNGLIADEVQIFVGSHWGEVRPFALHHENGEAVYHDPGAPPLLNGAGDEEFRAGNVQVLEFSSFLDSSDGVMIDISPGAMGNSPLGENSGTGLSVNPVTGHPYATNMVKRGDFGRVMAEFWADGPDSETPPGHWNALANDVTDHPLFERRFMGLGPELDALEWEVRLYFALNGALHDTAVAIWGCKAAYDYVRPISSIRYMASFGQSSDPGGLSYHVNGIPLVPGLIEVVDATTTLPAGKHEHLAGKEGKVAVFTWQGEPADPETEVSGADWILAEDWLPYQRDTFVTPAFAGYVSGHSGFSRAAAEVMTLITGSVFFPGGLMSYTYAAGELEFELGPTTDVELQWATYYDAADQAGISRLYGGIHVPVDDGPGRIIGSQCGIGAWNLAVKYFDGSILTEPFVLDIAITSPGQVRLSWDTERGLFYQVQEHVGIGGFANFGAMIQAYEDVGTVDVATGAGQIFRVIKSAGQ